MHPVDSQMAIPLISKAAPFSSVAGSMTKEKRLLVRNGINLKKWGGRMGASLPAGLHFGVKNFKFRISGDGDNSLQFNEGNRMLPVGSVMALRML